MRAELYFANRTTSGSEKAGHELGEKVQQLNMYFTAPNLLIVCNNGMKAPLWRYE